MTILKSMERCWKYLEGQVSENLKQNQRISSFYMRRNSLARGGAATPRSGANPIKNFTPQGRVK